MDPGTGLVAQRVHEGTLWSSGAWDGEFPGVEEEVWQAFSRAFLAGANAFRLTGFGCEASGIQLPCDLSHEG